jgi:hypothetical protein
MNEAIVKIKGQDPYIIRKEDIKITVIFII